MEIPSCSDCPDETALIILAKKPRIRTKPVFGGCARKGRQDVKVVEKLLTWALSAICNRHGEKTIYRFIFPLAGIFDLT